MNRTQIKMARAALGWRTVDLADKSGVHRVTIARFENGDNISPDNLAKLEAALVSAGAAFTAGKGRVGVSVEDREQ